MDEQPQNKRRYPYIRRAAVLALLVLVGLLLAVISFRLWNLGITPVMISDKLRGTAPDRPWVQLTDISQELRLAVIASEDGRFCDHWGVDWSAVRAAINEGRGISGGFRGASTIPMQTAKNLYLWPQREYARKMFEMPLAYLLSVLWPKKVVMETYLNIAPWGPGIVGAEAASRRYFQKSASTLTRREAVLLAVSLPKPSLRNPAKPSPRMLNIAQSIEKRMPILASRSACVLP